MDQIHNPDFESRKRLENSVQECVDGIRVQELITANEWILDSCCISWCSLSNNGVHFRTLLARVCAWSL